MEIPLSKNAKQEIKLYMKGYRDYLDIQKGYEDVLFLNKRGTALSRVMVFNIIKHLSERAGIKKQKAAAARKGGIFPRL